MAVPIDFEYLQLVASKGLLMGPCLEIGSYNHQGGPFGNCRSTVEDLGLKYAGADIAVGTDVDYVVDFSSAEAVAKTFGEAKFRTILLFNLLEHVFEPITVMDNALSVLDESGSIIAVTPAIWELHDFPKDYCRLNPHFYEEYASRRNLLVEKELFTFLSLGQIVPVRDGGPSYRLPSMHFDAYKRGLGYLYARIIQRLFRVMGRSFPFTYTSIGVTMTRHAGEQS